MSGCRTWRMALLLSALSACKASVGPLPVASNEAREAPEEEDALDLRLAALAQSLREEGFARTGASERGFLATNGRMTREVTIQPATCARFVAVATPSLIDLDASLYRGDGVPLLEDDGSDARPVLTLCASREPVRAYYTLHAYQGVGAFAIAQFVRPSTLNDDLSTTTKGEAEASALQDLAKVLHRRGFEDAGPRIELSLSAGQVLRVGIPAKSGECYTLAVEATPPLLGVALRLLDGSEELARGQGLAQHTALQYCADRVRNMALEVTASFGKGTLRVARFRVPQAAVGGEGAMWLGEPSPSDAAWPVQKARASDEATAPRAQERVFELSQGGVVSFESALPLGSCETWDAQLLPGLSRVTLLLESPDGSLLGEADSENMRASLSVCDRQGPVRVSVIGRAGFGRVLVAAVKGGDASTSSSTTGAGN